jgi:hypothetical protein
MLRNVTLLHYSVDTVNPSTRLFKVLCMKIVWGDADYIVRTLAAVCGVEKIP